MKFIYIIYNLITGVLFIIFFPFFWLYARLSGCHFRGINQRIGLYPNALKRNLNGSPIIWIHAVSVGEAGLARLLINPIKSKLPDSCIIISTTTLKGYDFAQNIFKKSKVKCIFAPIDFIASIFMAMRLFHPDILIFLETEIWPNWLVTARHKNIKTAIINGRISERSIKKYIKIKPLIKAALKNIDAFSMISLEDSKRIQFLGADPEKIKISGNAKFDLLTESVKPGTKIRIKNRLNLNENQSVIVAGSTRSNEEDIILNAFTKLKKFFPDLVLIIAPRHVERISKIISLVKSKQFSFKLYSHCTEKNKSRSEPVVIVDTIGELMEIYSAASIVFCGASLVPLGGQNILEPAVWGKPVIYGPFMDDFIEAKTLLESSSASVPVTDSNDFIKKAEYFLSHPDEAEILGKKARNVILTHRGAAEKHAEVISKLWRGRF
ncbi:3-deoxy-D-manno-octulosonic acid transferase [Candidatus Magnetomoraceae bacterium gMMP-15]